MSPYTITEDDEEIFFDTTSGDITALLPAGEEGRNFRLVSVGEGGNKIFLVSEKESKVIELATDDNGGKNWLYPSPDGKWISFQSEGFVKTRSQATMWEVEVEELIKGKEKKK